MRAANRTPKQESPPQDAATPAEKPNPARVLFDRYKPVMDEGLDFWEGDEEGRYNFVNGVLYGVAATLVANAEVPAELRPRTARQLFESFAHFIEEMYPEQEVAA